MTKRPLSLTIIAWFLIIFSLFGLYGVFTMGSNPVAMKMIQQMHMSLLLEQVWGVIGAVVNLVVAYGILKGQPWSRVLYVVWSIIGIVVGLYISPMKAVVALSLLFLIIIAFFLFRENADDWFSARGFMLRREPER
jgi:hypothetical protein